MNIGAFLSAAEVQDTFVKSVKTFGRLMGEAGHSLVWGGSNTGLMKVLADEVHAFGGRLIGVSVDFLANVARIDAEEMIIATDLAHRKAEISRISDAIVVFAGGTGTLDELTEVLELKKQGICLKPIVIMNTDGFYDRFYDQLRHMERNGFLTKPVDDLVHFVSNECAALTFLEDLTSNLRSQ